LIKFASSSLLTKVHLKKKSGGRKWGVRLSTFCMVDRNGMCRG
jgi:hypothetical protein